MRVRTVASSASSNQRSNASAAVCVHCLAPGHASGPLEGNTRSRSATSVSKAPTSSREDDRPYNAGSR